MRHYLKIFLWVISLTGLGWCVPCVGQQIASPTPSYEENFGQRPAIPVRKMRPLTIGGEAFSRESPQTPTNAFITPVMGTDAAIDLIVGQGRLLTMKRPISSETTAGVIAIGDPSIIDFEVLPNPKMIRIIGKRAGATDLTIVTAEDQVISFEIVVNFDLDLLRAQLSRHFPDCMVTVTQMREHMVLEGQVRNTAQIAQIELMVHSFIASMQPTQRGQQQNQGGDNSPIPDRPGATAPVREGDERAGDEGEGGLGLGELGGRASTDVQFVAGQVINLLRVPGVQQVMLQVRVAELNRTGLRQIGSDWLLGTSKGSVLGTQIAGSTVAAGATAGLGGLLGVGGTDLGSGGTAFGIFPSSDVNIMIRALRENSLLSILAEPNLVAMSGHQANFLAGGQFPVPVPQGGVGNQVTIQYKDFGVQLQFVPHVIDNQTVRLDVSPEVSTIDNSLGTTLVQGGLPIPGINTRRVSTTVEMREGETLALAGLLQLTLEARTSRIPGLGDLPYLGPFFSNTSHQRVEKELLVLVTPVMVAPVPAGVELAYPGEGLMDPNDLEFYLLNRIEGRTGRPYRSTTSWDDPLGCIQRMRLEARCIEGAVGLSR